MKISGRLSTSTSRCWHFGINKGIVNQTTRLTVTQWNLRYFFYIRKFYLLTSAHDFLNESKLFMNSVLAKEITGKLIFLRFLRLHQDIYSISSNFLKTFIYAFCLVQPHIFQLNFFGLGRHELSKIIIWPLRLW